MQGVITPTTSRRRASYSDNLSYKGETALFPRLGKTLVRSSQDVEQGGIGGRLIHLTSQVLQQAITHAPSGRKPDGVLFLKIKYVILYITCQKHYIENTAQQSLPM